MGFSSFRDGSSSCHLSFSLRAGILAVLAGLLTLSSAEAQEDPISRRFRLANSYVNAGQYRQALPLLEDLYEDDPTNAIFFEKLKETYVQLKEYDRAISLVDNQLELRPSPKIRADRGSLLYLKGDEDAASAEWKAAIEMAPLDVQTYRDVYYATSAAQLYQEAADALLQGRTNLESDALFRRDLAQVYSIMGRFDSAMEEYIALLLDSPETLDFVLHQVNRFGDPEVGYGQTQGVLERAVRRNPLNRSIRELAAWVYREAGDVDRAFDAYRAIDRLEQEEGRILYEFALNISDTGRRDVAYEALSEIITQYPLAAITPSAVLARADLRRSIAEAEGELVYDAAHNRLSAPNFDAALADYRAFTQKYPTDPRIPDVLWRLGDLRMRAYFELGEAEALFGEVLLRYPDVEVAGRARFGLGEIAMMRGDLRAARLEFGRLEKALRIGELAELARFELARIDFYEGHFQSALTLAEALDENTSTDIANDAIEIKVLLRENQGPDSLSLPLRMFAEASLLRRQRQPQKALATLDTLISRYPGHMLADEVAFLRSGLLTDLGDYRAALESYQLIESEHPGSYLVDRSIFEIADLYERRLDDPAAANRTYGELLLKYPGSMLGAEVRARMRRLREERVSL